MYLHFCRPGRPHCRRSPETALVLLCLALVLACAPLGAAPVNQSVSPNSASLAVGIEFDLTVVHSDALGGNTISGSYLLLNSAVDGADAVYLFYSAAENRLFLRNDAGNAWMAGASPGANTVLQNSRCKVYCARTVVSASGTTRTVRWRLELKPSMAGRSLRAFAYCTSSSGWDGWDQLRSYTVGTVPVQSPVNISLSGRLSIGSMQTITAIYSDADGAGNLAGCYLLANKTLNGASGIYLWYDVANNKLWARNEANTAWVGGYAPGSSNTIETSLFAMDCSKTTVTQGTNNLTIAWKVQRKASSQGASLNVWMYVADRVGRAAGWTLKAVWPNVAPECNEVDYDNMVVEDPENWIGALFDDYNGPGDIKGCYLLVNTALDGRSAVYLWYDAAANRIYLRNDANTAWIGGFAPGSPNVIENAQCKVHCADTYAVADGYDMWVDAAVELKGVMAGKRCSVWTYAVDYENANTGWVRKASVTPFRAGPENVSITPGGGELPGQTSLVLKATVAHPGGIENLSDVYLLLNEVLSGANACYLHMDQDGKLFLRNDQNTEWLGGYYPGDPYTIENSTVRLHCASSDVTFDESGIAGAPATASVSWSVEFRSPASSREVSAWMYVKDTDGKSDGWDKMGQYVIRPFNPGVAQGRLQSLLSQEASTIDACEEFNWFQAYRTAHPGDKTGLVGWSVARVACAVTTLQDKYAVSDGSLAAIKTFRGALSAASGDGMAQLAYSPVSVVTNHGVESLLSTGSFAPSSLGVQPASSVSLTPAALTADIRNEIVPALEDSIAALAPAIADSSFVATMVFDDERVAHIRSEELQMYRAALEAVLALLSTAVAYSWDDTGFDWNRSPEEMDLNQDGLLTPAEYLPGGTFGMLADASSLTRGWTALNAAVDDGLAVADSSFPANDPDQLLKMVVEPPDWGEVQAALDQAKLVLSGLVVVPCDYRSRVWRYDWYYDEFGWEWVDEQAFVTFNLSSFWLHPIASLRALWPVLAVQWDDWGYSYCTLESVPDPTMNGLFPRGASQIPLELWNEWFGSGLLGGW